jgi:hypothetical protein
VAQGECRWGSRDLVRTRETCIICSSKPKMHNPPKPCSPLMRYQRQIVTGSARLCIFHPCPHHVSRIMSKEHAKRSSDDGFSQLPAFFFITFAQDAAPKAPRLPLQGAARPTGNCFWDSIDLIYHLRRGALLLGQEGKEARRYYWTCFPGMYVVQERSIVTGWSALGVQGLVLPHKI